MVDLWSAAGELPNTPDEVSWRSEEIQYASRTAHHMKTVAARLKRWGLLDTLKASNCPPILTNHFDYGAFSLTGSPVPEGGVTEAFAPRRIKLDPILVDAAVKSGAELREGFSVQEVIFEDGRVVGIRGHEKRKGGCRSRTR